VDLVTLANNHAYDYGRDAFLDTMTHLEEHGVSYVGGGVNAEAAQHPVYYLVDGRKIAFVSATRAEKYILTPEAGENTPGVFRCYDPRRLLEVIAEAKAQSDYVILLPHWGKEGSHQLEPVMEETARLYVDAGADLIVGAHAHRLQGIEFYEDAAIFYNLGNFWFDHRDVEVGLMQFELSADGEETLRFLPGMQSGCVTSYELGTSLGRTILDHLESYSKGIRIEDDGLIVRT
jgi:poly-gamma-glutamate synthesis protein (capsule biosynthesis protein)